MSSRYGQARKPPRPHAAACAFAHPQRTSGHAAARGRCLCGWRFALVRPRERGHWRSWHEACIGAAGPRAPASSADTRAVPLRDVVVDASTPADQTSTCRGSHAAACSRSAGRLEGRGCIDLQGPRHAGSGAVPPTTSITSFLSLSLFSLLSSLFSCRAGGLATAFADKQAQKTNTENKHKEHATQESSKQEEDGCPASFPARRCGAGPVNEPARPGAAGAIPRSDP